MKKKASPDRPLFLVGKDSHGHWVAQDQSGQCGGLFVGCADAVKFALSENGNRREAVIVVDGPLELDMTATPAALPQYRPSGRRASRRRSAA